MARTHATRDYQTAYAALQDQFTWVGRPYAKILESARSMARGYRHRNRQVTYAAIDFLRSHDPKHCG